MLNIHLFLKRLFDVVSSAMAIAIFSPILLALAIAVRLDSPGPVLFRQKRLTKDGREFTMYKFRSMVQQTDEDEMYASELKGVLLRLRPDFNEKSFGCASFGKLLNKLSAKFGTIRVKNENNNVYVSLNADAPEEAGGKKLNADNWRTAFTEQLQHYKDDGFERINPSILKADVQAAYPDFSERAIGFKRFSDVLKQMEKDRLLTLEMDEQKNMLIKML